MEATFLRFHWLNAPSNHEFSKHSAWIILRWKAIDLLCARRVRADICHAEELGDVVVVIALLDSAAASSIGLHDLNQSEPRYRDGRLTPALNELGAAVRRSQRRRVMQQPQGPATG